MLKMVIQHIINQSLVIVQKFNLANKFLLIKLVTNINFVQLSLKYLRIKCKYKDPEVMILTEPQWKFKLRCVIIKLVKSLVKENQR